MKIQFDKIHAAPKPFETGIEGIRFQGNLKKSGYHLVELDGVIAGDIVLECDRCGQSYNHALKSKLKLSLSDQVCKDKEDLDIIEFLDGVIDITYILEGEINAQKTSYHYCPQCDNSEIDFEIEF